MNIAKKISFFALVALLMASCKDTAKDGNIETNEDAEVADTMQTETAANTATTTFTIEGMTCPMGCAKTIENKLAGLDGVQEAKVDYDNKTATISYDAAKQSPEKIVETVEGIADGAYKVSDVHNSADKAMLYSTDQEPEKKADKKKKSSKTADSTKDAKPSCGTEGKKGCCGGSKSCGEKKA